MFYSVSPDEFSVNLARFMFCYLLLWRIIFSSVNLAWFMFYVLCFAICFFGEYFYRLIARFMFCYLLLWRAISSVNLAWFMFYVLCPLFTTFILPILSGNGLLFFSIAEFMFYVLPFIIIRDKGSGEYHNLLSFRFYVNDLARFMIYVLYLCKLPCHSLDFKPIYLYYNLSMFRIYDLPNLVFILSCRLYYWFYVYYMKHKTQETRKT